MSTHRSINTTTITRLVAAFIAAALVVSACGSTDDGNEVVSRAEATPVAETETPTTGPTAVDPTPSQPEAIPIEVPDLVGQDWYVVAVDSTRADVLPRPSGAVARIRFNRDGTITGNAGCNDFTADYAVDFADLSITNFAITEMNCFIPDWSAFVEFLPQTSGFGSAGGPEPILFVGSDTSISLGSTPPDPAASPIADYLGLTELEAAQLADTRSVAFRVSSIDGDPQALTLDFVEDRVNVDLVDGVVVGGNLG